MTSSDYQLGPIPEERRAREIWLQHVAGFVLFEDVARYAEARLDPGLTPREREVAMTAIEDALYGLMMRIDGVQAPLRGGGHEVRLRFSAELVRPDADDEVVHSVDLFEEGDGMCMGFDEWKRGRFGAFAPVRRDAGAAGGGAGDDVG